jgi:hypothetical protein
MHCDWLMKRHTKVAVEDGSVRTQTSRSILLPAYIWSGSLITSFCFDSSHDRYQLLPRRPLRPLSLRPQLRKRNALEHLRRARYIFQPTICTLVGLIVSIQSFPYHHRFTRCIPRYLVEGAASVDTLLHRVCYETRYVPFQHNVRPCDAVVRLIVIVSETIRARDVKFGNGFWSWHNWC